MSSVTGQPLSLAYSPCPNDTFIFAAWTRGFLPDAPSVDIILDDVEALNLAAEQGKHVLTKVSYGAIPYLAAHYRILRSGGALGRGCGPLVVAKMESGLHSLSDLSDDAIIAIPGNMTTAFLLLQLALERRPKIVVMRFDRIIDAVACGQVDAGLIIHESRFTYASSGLCSIADLGAWWESTTGHPIPLGAILVRRDLSLADARHVDATISESLRYAYAHPHDVASYVREHAFEMSPEVMQAHIDLYVNDYSFDIGVDGKAAIAELFSRASKAGLITATQPDFVS